MRRPYAALATFALGWFASCSLQNFDYLHRGRSTSGRSSEGGTAGSTLDGGTNAGANSGGAATGFGGVQAGAYSGGAAAGLTDTGGATSDGAAAGFAGAQGGANSGGAAAGFAGAQAGGSESGGTGGSSGSAGGGTTNQTGGANSGGESGSGTAGSTSAGGARLDSTCPSDPGMGGTLLMPPSTSFETAGTWRTHLGNTCTVVGTGGSGNACEGSSFLRCSSRTGAPYDGPMIRLEPYLVEGHQYYVTAAMRYSPETAPATAGGLEGLVVVGCGAERRYFSLGYVTGTYNWLRVGGQVEASQVGSCTSLSEFFFYSGTPAEGASNWEYLATLSLDMDDFRVYDLTAPSTGGSGSGGGAGGAVGQGGAAGQAGVAGGG